MKKEKPKTVKDRGEGGGRFDRGQRFNAFFLKAFLSDVLDFYLKFGISLHAPKVQ